MHNGGADDIAKLIEPGRVHRRVYTDPDIFELEMERIFGRAWLFVGHTSQGAASGRLRHHRARPPAGDHDPAPRRQRARAAQPLHPPRRQGGQRAQGPFAAPDLLLPRLDLRHRRPLGDGAGAGRLRRRLRQVGVRPRPRAARRRISRLRVRESQPQGAELRGPYRSDEAQHRRPGRPRARRHLGARRRHAPLRLQRQLEAPGRERARLLPRAVRPRLDRQQAGPAVRPPRGRPEGRHRGGGGQEADRRLLEGPQELHHRQRPRLDQQHHARRGQALEPGLRRLQAGAGREGRRRARRRDPHPAAAQLADLSQHVDHGAQHPRAGDQAGRGRPHRGDDLSDPPRRRARRDEFRQHPPAQRHPLGVVVRADRRSGVLRARAKGLRSLGTDWVDISRGLGDEEPDRELNATRALATHEMVVRAQYKAWTGYMREAA